MVYKKVVYSRRPRYSQQRRRPFKKINRVRKLAGTQPETAIDRIASGVGTVATIAKTVSGIVSMINTEDKYLDVQLSGSLSTAGAYSAVLNAIAQGADRNQRNGNKVEIKCLQIIMVLTFNTPVDQPQAVRLVLVIDKKPQIGALLYSAAYNGAGNPFSVHSQISKDSYGDRLVILKDWRIVLDPQGPQKIFIKKYFNLERLHTQYYSSNSTDFESGRIHLIGIADQPGTSLPVSIEGTSRFCFHDN